MQLFNFDPDGTGQDNGNYFGLPFTPEQSRLVLISVPWDVTASYGAGSRFGPDAMIGASIQLDLYDELNPGAWRQGIGTVTIDYSIQEVSEFLRDDAVKVMKHLENGGSADDDHIRKKTERINDASHETNLKVYRVTKKWLEQGKIIGLVGGDHSTPFGFVQALAERQSSFSILHIDAHADLRRRYEGFADSHASIMYNISENIPQVEKIVQVGIRDQCDFEAEYARGNPRIEQFTDFTIAKELSGGRTWEQVCGLITAPLGDKVYISFDIDGLSPEYAPHTGTPVPGGLTFNQAIYLLWKITESGRTIIGFDLCEVCPRVGDELDANVGARILYKLCGLALKTDK